jgi:hypothetical protein
VKGFKENNIYHLIDKERKRIVHRYHNEHLIVRIASTCVLIILLILVIKFQISYISGYWIEHTYNFSNQTSEECLKDKAKSFFVGFIPGTILFEVFYSTTYHTPKFWWLYLSFKRNLYQNQDEVRGNLLNKYEW